MASEAFSSRLNRLSQGSDGEEVQALLWLDQDVLIHDHFLVDRILELEPGSWALNDDSGLPMLMVRRYGERMDGPLLTPKDLPWSVCRARHSGPFPSAKGSGSTPLLFVTATRRPAQQFYTETALGRSLQALRRMGMQCKLLIHGLHQSSLADAYNPAITPEHADHILVFMHDDVTVHDWHLGWHIQTALEKFDVVGVAGCQTARGLQPGWAFSKTPGVWAPPNELLGWVSHDVTTQAATPVRRQVMSRYGHTHGRAALMDGVLLACRGRTLLDHDIRFDPQLAFHFYDLDFCQQVRRAGLTMGVWPLAITHHSGGHFGSPQWHATHQTYLKKWQAIP